MSNGVKVSVHELHACLAAGGTDQYKDC